MELFQLLGTIAIDNSEANKNIDDTTEKAGSFSDKLKSGIGTVGKWGAAIVGGTAAAVGGLSAFAASSASTADNIDKMSQKIGISREAYQELDFICSQSGTSVDALRVGMKTLTNALSGAQTASAGVIEQEAALEAQLENGEISLDEYNKKYDEMYDAAYKSCGGLEQLGFSLDEISKMSPEDALYKTIEALQGMPDDANRAALAQDLLGRSAQELAPLLNSGVGSMEEMKQQAHDLGLVLDDELVDSGVELTDSLDQTKRAFSSIATQLGASLMPIVTKVSDYIQKGLPYIQKLMERLEPIITSLFDELLPPLMDLAEQIFPVLMDLIEQILPPVIDVVKELLPVISELIAMLLPPLVEIVQALLPVLVEIITSLMPILQPLLECLQPILDLIVALLPPLVELINIVIMPLVDLFSALIQAYLPKLKEHFEVIATYITTVFNVAVMSIKDIIDNIKISFEVAWDAIKKAWEGAAGFFSGIWDGIKGAFSTVSDWFHDTFSAAWQKVKDVFSKGGKIFDGIKEGISDTFKIVVNGLIGGINKVVAVPFKAINGMLNKIRDAGVGKLKPFKGLWDNNPINIPEIPELEEGGILAKGQVGLLEGNGAEAVVPLEKNTQWIDRIAERLQDNVASDEVIKRLELLLSAIQQLMEQLIGMQIVLDSGTLVGEITPKIDQQLGLISGHKGRGN